MFVVVGCDIAGNTGSGTAGIGNTSCKSWTTTWEWSANTPQRLTARPPSQWESPTRHMTESWTQNRNLATIRICGSNFWWTDIVPVRLLWFNFCRKYLRLRQFRFRCFRLRHIRPSEDSKHLQVMSSGTLIGRVACLRLYNIATRPTADERPVYIRPVEYICLRATSSSSSVTEVVDDQTRLVLY